MSIEIKPVCLSKNRHPSFIGAYILSNPAVCDDLIGLMKCPMALKNGEIHQGVVYKNEGAIVDKSQKDAMQRHLNWNEPSGIAYGTDLHNCLLAYLKEFQLAGMVQAFNNGVEAPQIQKYEKGAGYHAWHGERNGRATSLRHLVFMTYLNDVSDGGETEFFYQKLKVKPRKGLTLIWPSDWTHTHRGIPSPTQEKYIVTGWYCFA